MAELSYRSPHDEVHAGLKEVVGRSGLAAPIDSIMAAG
jgi:hypothetical protein